MSRGAQVIMQILNRKAELNANLDKERKRGSKEGAFQGFSHTTVCWLIILLKSIFFYFIIVHQLFWSRIWLSFECLLSPDTSCEIKGA